VLAWIFTVVAGCYYLMERRGLSLRPLVVLGRAALFLYLAHHVIVVTVVQRALGLSLRSWALYWLATGLLLAALVALGAGWTRLTRARRARAAERPADLSAAA
jgi:peptidoglycan/LPS O-acetylase OafA/YrhL